MTLPRRHLLHGALGLAAWGALPACARGGPVPSPSPSLPVSTPPAARLPVVFVGHGSPMNAIEDSPWSRGFAALGKALPTPRAVLAISAHWYLPALALTGNGQPPTIHDFGGFPQALYQQQYPAPGDPALAARVARSLGPRAQVRDDWGLDHGTWTVLKHLRPQADLPVVQLSLDERLTLPQHLEVARALRPLREQGVLIMASGNVTHNLRAAMMALRTGDVRTPEWAARFDADVAGALEQQDAAWFTRALDSDAGRLAHPTPDHFLPLLYAVGLADGRDTATFPLTGFDLGSLSMRAAVLG